MFATSRLAYPRPRGLAPKKPRPTTGVVCLAVCNRKNMYFCLIIVNYSKINFNVQSITGMDGVGQMCYHYCVSHLINNVARPLWAHLYDSRGARPSVVMHAAMRCALPQRISRYQCEHHGV